MFKNKLYIARGIMYLDLKKRGFLQSKHFLLF
jgi:hypothetical protein